MISVWYGMVDAWSSRSLGIAWLLLSSKNDYRAQVGAPIFLKIIQNKHDNDMNLENGEV
jgi:hypothetical protein